MNGRHKWLWKNVNLEFELCYGHSKKISSVIGSLSPSFFGFLLSFSLNCSILFALETPNYWIHLPHPDKLHSRPWQGWYAPVPTDRRNSWHPFWVVSRCTILVVKDFDYCPSLALCDKSWLHIWILFYPNELFFWIVLAELFFSAPLWVSKVEDKQKIR